MDPSVLNHPAKNPYKYSLFIFNEGKSFQVDGNPVIILFSLRTVKKNLDNSSFLSPHRVIPQEFTLLI